MKSLSTCTLHFASILILSMGGCSDDPGLDPGPAGRTIWRGEKIIFTKKDGADWTLAAHQDRLSANVWITRADTKGIFNIKAESGYDGMGTTGASPADTEWAFGTVDDSESLTFDSWAMVADNDPQQLLGKDMVLHLISENIFLNVKFLAWSSAKNGGEGGFSYARTSGP